MAISDILEIGRQGLVANREALQTTANNVSNANTPGYSRQRAQMVSREATARHGVRVGGGVEVKEVIRVHDGFVQKQILDESKGLGGARARVDALSRIEPIVQIDGKELNGRITKFFNDFRELSANPETSTVRSVVRESSESLANGFQKMSDSLIGLSDEIDMRIGGAIEDINRAAKEVAGLNDSIQRFEAIGNAPNELYDQRDAILRDLAQKVDLQITTDERNQVHLVTSGNVLVQGNIANQLGVSRTPADEHKADGSVDVYMQDYSGRRKITHGIKDGELAGLIKVRDTVVRPSLAQLDNIAYQLCQEVNRVHALGVGLDGLSERTLFKQLGETAVGAANRFQVSDEVKATHEAIAVGFSKSAPGDNQIALEIAEIQNQRLMPSGIDNGFEKLDTINESMNHLVANVGVHSQNEDSNFQHQQAIVDQLNSYRESVCGVNIEEEAIKMMQYQTAFHAAAKAMKVGDELFQTVLSLKP